MKAVVLLVSMASVALALVATGCGGDDGGDTTAVEWMEEFCTATQAWQDEIERIADDVSDLSSFSIEDLEDAAAEAREATDDYVEEVRDLGAPDTASGDEIESSVETLADEIEAESAEIEDAVDDATGLTGLATAGRDIASSVASMFTALERTFRAFEDTDPDGELETAFEDAEACDDLSS